MVWSTIKKKNSDVPRAEGNVFILLLLSDQQSKPDYILLTLIENREKQFGSCNKQICVIGVW